MKRVLLCLSHSVEEFDQLRLLHSLGYEVASIGGYIDPAHPHDPKRPALPEIPCVQEVKDAVDAQGLPDNLGAAQARIPEPVLEWLGADGVIMFHHYLDQRLYPQWGRLEEWRAAGGRVIWRTVGQSVEHNERLAAPYRVDGLEIVRYSPKERNIPGYAGEDALIRFYKDPADWNGWRGHEPVVVQFTQHLKQRDPFTNYEFWLNATCGLPARACGPGSEEIGGPGPLSQEEMIDQLRAARAYLYTGTQPASYTLGLLEALMVGVPVVSIGPAWMDVFSYGPDLFEGHELVEASHQLWSNDEHEAKAMLGELLDDVDVAREVSESQREQTTAEFGMDVVGAAWRDYLGAP